MGKKEDIIASARNLFNKYNFDKVSMEEIAKKAGVTKKTIYSYFKDKQELFEYFISEELNCIKEKIEQTAKKDETFLEKISENLNSILTINDNNQLLFNLIDERSEKNFHNQDFFRVYETKIISYLEKKINDEIKNGNIRKCDAKLTAFIIYKTIYSITFEYAKITDNKKIIREVTDILTNGLLVKGGVHNEK